MIELVGSELHLPLQKLNLTREPSPNPNSGSNLAPLLLQKQTLTESLALALTLALTWRLCSCRSSRGAALQLEGRGGGMWHVREAHLCGWCGFGGDW